MKNALPVNIIGRALLLYWVFAAMHIEQRWSSSCAGMIMWTEMRPVDAMREL